MPAFSTLAFACQGLAGHGPWWRARGTRGGWDGFLSTLREQKWTEREGEGGEADWKVERAKSGGAAMAWPPWPTTALHRGYRASVGPDCAKAADLLGRAFLSWVLDKAAERRRMRGRGGVRVGNSHRQKNNSKWSLMILYQMWYGMTDQSKKLNDGCLAGTDGQVNFM